MTDAYQLHPRDEMNRPPWLTRYNQRIPHMRARTSSGLRLSCLTSFLLATVFLPSSLCASSLGDAARQLAHKIAAATGPGAVALDVANHSSLDDKSVREVRGALEAQLHVEGVRTAKAEQAMGTVEVVLSESLREYVWTAEIAIGSDEKKVALVSLPRSPTETPFAAALPIVLKTTLLFAQEQPMLDVALVEMPGGSRLLVLDDGMVAIYRRQGANPGGRWELEASLPIAHSRTFPRDLRGRLLLRRDHLFDAYLPGTFCRTNSSALEPLTLTCNDTDDPWPLTPDDSVRAFFAPARNFFTGALSPGIGEVSNVPSFYSAAAFPRLELHVMGTRCRRWVVASCRWDDGPSNPQREVGQRSGCGSLQLRNGHTGAGLGGRRYGTRRPARVRGPRPRPGGCQCSGRVRRANRRTVAGKRRQWRGGNRKTERHGMV